jgi:S1-C subfamily serine protease
MDVSMHDDGQQQIRALGGNLIVNEVMPGSRAERLGLLPGDAIKRIDGQPVATVEDVMAAVRRGGLLKVEVVRYGKSRSTFEETDDPTPVGL